MRLDAVVDIRRWAEDYEEHVAIAERCGRVLDRADGRAFVAERLDEADEALERVADRRGDGPRPVGGGLAHLQHAPADAGLYHELARTTNAERWERLAAFAERALPLVALASGPRDRLLPPPQQREAALALAALVQDMRPGRWSAPLRRRRRC